MKSLPIHSAKEDRFVCIFATDTFFSAAKMHKNLFINEFKKFVFTLLAE